MFAKEKCHTRALKASIFSAVNVPAADQDAGKLPGLYCEFKQVHVFIIGCLKCLSECDKFSALFSVHLMFWLTLSNTLFSVWQRLMRASIFCVHTPFRIPWLCLMGGNKKKDGNLLLCHLSLFIKMHWWKNWD